MDVITLNANVAMNCVAFLHLISYVVSCYSCGQSYPCACGQDPHAPGFRPNNFAAAIYAPWAAFRALREHHDKKHGTPPAQ